MEERNESRRAADLEPRTDTPPGGAYALLDSSPNPILATDLAGRIRYCLNAKVESAFGYSGKGTGLGLATIYGIMQQADGHVWLSSEPGIGSSFKLYFPRVDAPAAGPHADRPHRAKGAGGSLMVVEDELSVREMTTLILRRAGYDVDPVADAAEAIQHLDALDAPIDVLVTDVVMPGMSGIELAERVLDRYPTAGVVMLSGYTAETLDLERVIDRGGIFLSKPVPSGELISAVRSAAGRRTADRRKS